MDYLKCCHDLRYRLPGHIIDCILCPSGGLGINAKPVIMSLEKTMSQQYSRSVSDYLKAIYELTLSSEQTSTVVLAEKLAVAPSSVTSMLKKLARHEPPLVVYQKSYGVS
ncbi:hypothetical protein EG832_03260, partial [bacterium]|nr:hypothetical protein [bacterium]